LSLAMTEDSQLVVGDGSSIVRTNVTEDTILCVTLFREV
jgi:hypothetical protein